jgi:signal peptidase II
MKTKRILRVLIVLIVLISNVGCDRISKHIVRQKVDYNERISVIDHYLTITKTENTGAFLSLGNGLSEPVRIAFLIILPLIVIGVFMYYMLTSSRLSNLKNVGISFFIGGGIGNIYDRIMIGSVTDFLHMDFVVFQTGIFNMADVSIMAGIFILLLDIIFHRKRPDYKTAETQS